MSKYEFPTLEGWTTVAHVAEELNVSRQAVHKMLTSFHEGEVCKIEYGVRPFYLISSEALTRLVAEKGLHDINSEGA